MFSATLSMVTPGWMLFRISSPSYIVKQHSGVTMSLTLPFAVTKSTLSVKVRRSCLVRQITARFAVGISTALPAPPGRRTFGLR